MLCGHVYLASFRWQSCHKACNQISCVAMGRQTIKPVEGTVYLVVFVNNHHLQYRPSSHCKACAPCGCAIVRNSLCNVDSAGFNVDNVPMAIFRNELSEHPLVELQILTLCSRISQSSSCAFSELLRIRRHVVVARCKQGIHGHTVSPEGNLGCPKVMLDFGRHDKSLLSVATQA